MKTIAQQLNIKSFPFEVKDNNGNLLYREDNDGYWVKKEYNNNGSKQTYYINSYDFWFKREYDEKNNLLYYENSEGEIRDNRSKTLELTLEDIANKFNIDVNLIKIKK